MSNYTAPPPAYPADGNGKNYSATDESTRPLLGSPRQGPSSGPGAIFDQPDGELPDDFKVWSCHYNALTFAQYF